MAEPSDVIIEEREELMVPPTGDGNPTLRTAHFLKPTIPKPALELPSIPIPYRPNTSELTKPRLQVLFKGRRNPQKNWKTWVDRLHCTYQSIWKKAGIYEAIMSSTYHIQRHNDLELVIAEKWCSETNTFIFAWGEATITLEDVMVLGGYSVLGDSVLSPLESRDMVEMMEKLIESYRQIKRTTGQLPGHYTWMDHFMGCRLELEHEAFLALWLSRYVFPENLYETIGKHLFPIAIRLARGIPIALAPAVLASLYRDLGLLKGKIVASNKLVTGESKGNRLSLILWAPFQLVQLWVWERFPTLRPKPNFIKYGEPRSAKWHKLTKMKVENVRLVIDSAGEFFQWRPYAAAVSNWSFHMFYREKEEWLLVNSDLDTEFESFARCLRVCKLVGLDCIEQYLPHRVAMQFGLDQDIPDRVCRSNETPEIAWSNYNRSIGDTKLYVPPRLFESDVTTRYSRWWKLCLAWQDVNKGIVRQRRSSRQLPRDSKRKKEAEDSVNEDKLTLSELLTSNGKLNDMGRRLVSDVKPSLGIQARTLSCTASSVMIREEKLLMEPVEKIMQSEALVGGAEKATEDANENQAKSPVNDTLNINDYNGESSSFGTTEVPGRELEARISNLEKVTARLRTKHD